MLRGELLWLAKSNRVYGEFMKDIQEYLSIRSSFSLSEAALLLTKRDPGVWSDKKLLNKPPPSFKAIYGRLLKDAVDIVDEAAESEEYPGEYCTVYALNTDKPENLKKLSYKDGFSVMVQDSELTRWLRARRRLQTIKKEQKWAREKEDETSLFEEITLFKLADIESIETEHSEDDKHGSLCKPTTRPHGVSAKRITEHFDFWDQSRWKSLLAKPPQWLETARIKPVVPRKAAYWNPAEVANCLLWYRPEYSSGEEKAKKAYARRIPAPANLEKIVQHHFPDWLADWKPGPD
jgi:hypothetical protein